MEIDIELGQGPGRPLQSKAAFVRALNEADLALLEAGVTRAPKLKSLRDSHHAAARAIAGGMKHSEVALITGYSPTRISQLVADPAFADLVSFYRQNLDAAYSGLFEKFAAFSKDLFDELRERFEADPDSFSNPFILEMMKVMADRSGTGPRSTQVNINIDLASRLEAARRQAGMGGAPPLVLDSPVEAESTRRTALAPPVKEVVV